MPSGREIRCRLLWTLARRHGWGSPVDAETLLRSALASSAQGRGRELIDDLRYEPYLDRGPDGYFLYNDPDSQALAALRLRDTCGYSQLQVEATLSRFEQAGGFDAYDESALDRTLSEWA
ncbi:hypothetical protein [Salinarchaeum laminariae]|uniref:hypothetical protein n=1 Tax=Salinarchaeum laminariae TaxID=869888 RepID=UPI0020C02C4D|nr:hypothetical protein [Salinarchaeum laminariae]